MKNLIGSILFVILSGVSSMETGKKSGADAGNVLELQSMQLNTDGLYYAEFFDYIYRGHFENVEITQEDMEFLTIFASYLTTFSKECYEYLPEDKVNIMGEECAVENVTTNGFGIETNRYCIEWRTYDTGHDARPELYEAQLQVQRMQNANAMGTALTMMTDPNAVGNSVDMIHKVNGLRNDWLNFFQLNPCNSPGIRRFEENLRLFALNKPSIRVETESKYAIMKKSGGPLGPQDLSKLVDDLVINQSKTWAFNRYIPGSITGLAIRSNDNKGRPLEVKANYSYNGFSGRSNGWVRVTFIDGLPKCIYFFDYPNNCKDPSSSILASYSNGDYSEN